MTSKIHYIVRHGKLITNVHGETDVQVFTNKIFRDEEPIIARKLAFEYLKNYQEEVELGRSIVPKEEIEIYKPNNKDQENTLKKSDFLPQELSDSLQDLDLHEDYLIWSQKNPDKDTLRTPFGRPAIILVKDSSLIDGWDHQNEIAIHYHVNKDDPYDISNLMMWLDEEYTIYQQLGYNTGNEIVQIPFWDPEIFDHQNENERVFDVHHILNTSFDWSKYAVPNWWSDPEFYELLWESSLIPKNHLDEINTLLSNSDNVELDIEIRTKRKKKSHKKRIEEGENQRVEFKPEIIGESYDKTRSFEFEVAKVITSFLNTKGGFLYIGIDDKDKTIKGTQMHGKTEDEYTNEFTTRINRWFNRGVIDDNVNAKFISLDNKRVFLIKVRGSFKPIFLKKKEENKKTVSEFYVRRDNSSRVLYDEAMIDYIESHWWNKKYK